MSYTPPRTAGSPSACGPWAGRAETPSGAATRPHWTRWRPRRSWLNQETHGVAFHAADLIPFGSGDTDGSGGGVHSESDVGPVPR